MPNSRLTHDDQPTTLLDRSRCNDRPTDCFGVSQNDSPAVVQAVAAAAAADLGLMMMMMVIKLMDELKGSGMNDRLLPPKHSKAGKSCGGTTCLGSFWPAKEGEILLAKRGLW